MSYVARAPYNYNAEDPMSLHLGQAEIIEVVEQPPGGRPDGIPNGARGWFPSNYLTAINTPERSIAKNPQRPIFEATLGFKDNFWPVMIFPQDFADLLRSHLANELLLLDLRVFPDYSESRIGGAINLCLPTTLLKRSSFDLQEISQTLKEEGDILKFRQWREARFLVVYDADSSDLKSANSAVLLMGKFRNERFRGATLIIKGGFGAFSKEYPEQVDDRPVSQIYRLESKVSSKNASPSVPTKTPEDQQILQSRQRLSKIGGKWDQFKSKELKTVKEGDSFFTAIDWSGYSSIEESKLESLHGDLATRYARVPDREGILVGRQKPNFGNLTFIPDRSSDVGGPVSRPDPSRGWKTPAGVTISSYAAIGEDPRSKSETDSHIAMIVQRESSHHELGSLEDPEIANLGNQDGLSETIEDTREISKNQKPLTTLTAESSVTSTTCEDRGKPKTNIPQARILKGSDDDLSNSHGKGNEQSEEPCSNTFIAVPETNDGRPTTLPASIHVCNDEEYTIVNSLKGYIQDLTTESWNWWPLEPRYRHLEPNEARVQWNCVSHIARD